MIQRIIISRLTCIRRQDSKVRLRDWKSLSLYKRQLTMVNLKMRRPIRRNQKLRLFPRISPLTTWLLICMNRKWSVWIEVWVKIRNILSRLEAHKKRYLHNRSSNLSLFLSKEPKDKVDLEKSTKYKTTKARKNVMTLSKVRI